MRPSNSYYVTSCCSYNSYFHRHPGVDSLVPCDSSSALIFSVVSVKLFCLNYMGMLCSFNTFFGICCLSLWLVFSSSNSVFSRWTAVSWNPICKAEMAWALCITSKNLPPHSGHGFAPSYKFMFVCVLAQVHMCACLSMYRLAGNLTCCSAKYHILKLFLSTWEYKRPTIIS